MVRDISMAREQEQHLAQAKVQNEQLMCSIAAEKKLRLQVLVPCFMSFICIRVRGLHICVYADGEECVCVQKLRHEVHVSQRCLET